ncbi:MAG TPA: carbon-nitrogen hydrolase family protein [Candidatus Limnocylindria bacterium]|jgi:predicted amidohydrolase|nr:carbon-nitrogen hydrolase family protein [Candidatus Limnocylindria bacterium]
MRIALGQITAGRDKAANRETIAAYVRRAADAGAHLIVFPEASMHDFGPPEMPLGPVAETLDGPFVTALREAAARHHVGILAGMFETSPEPGRVYNTLVYVDADANLAGSYRKIHLYDALGFVESDRLVAGDGQTLTFTSEGMRFGAMTCYDLRFPELARRLVDEGAEALLLPAAWLHGVLKENHLVTLARARAIENTAYFCVADMVGGAYSGNSLIVDPMGVVLASGGEVEALVCADLDRARVEQVRTKLPSVANRRPDIYAGWEQRTLAARE